MVTTILRKASKTVRDALEFIQGESTTARLQAESDARIEAAQAEANAEIEAAIARKREAYEALKQRILEARASGSYRVVSLDTGEEVPESKVSPLWYSKEPCGPEDDS